MKKLLLLAALGCAGFAAQAEDYTVYSNGVLAEGINSNMWYNAVFSTDATDPAGTGKVIKMEAGNLDYGSWMGGYADASIGFQTSDLSIIGPLSTATLHFSWYKVGTGTYQVKLTGDTEESINFSDNGQANQWNQASINIADYKDLAESWATTNEANEFTIFSIILTQGQQDDVIYINNVYYSDINEDYEAPAPPTYETPDYVIAPTQSPSDVLSIFSSAYTPATKFNIGSWEQSTIVENLEIDGQIVEFLKNFNYLGWEFQAPDNILDVSDYEYLHVEYWTAEGTDFGVTPVCSNGTATEQNWQASVQSSVKKGEWNVYDIPLTYYSNLNLKEAYQLKFDNGGSVYGYIANVYFWKEGEEAEPVAAPTALYLLGDTYAWNQEFVTDWNPAQALAFTAGEEDGVFIIEGVQFNNTTSYFTFTNILDSDWEVINDGTHRYCPVTLLQAASIASENPFGLGQIPEGPDSWTITPGVYDFTVDFNTMTFTVAVSDVEAIEPPTVTIPDALYLIGNFPGNTDVSAWDLANTIQFTASTEAGIFNLAGVELADAGSGLAYFGLLNVKVTSWDDIALENRYGPEAAATASLTAPNAFDFSDQSWNIAPGSYDFTVNFNTLEMTVKAAATDAIDGLQVNGLEEGVYYNLQGIRVANPKKGIFILNGKKVLVK